MKDGKIMLFFGIGVLVGDFGESIVSISGMMIIVLGIILILIENTNNKRRLKNEIQK